MAMEVLASPNIDGESWSEAVKWLLLYGPPEVREMIQQASSLAFSEHFPGIEAKGYSAEGSPFYDLQDIAAALGVPAAEVADKLAELQFEEGVKVFVEGDHVFKVH